MSFWRRRWVVPVLVLVLVVALLKLQSVAVAQGPAVGSGAGTVPPVPHFASLKSIPVPYDPLELAPSGAQEVQSAEERAAALDMLARARRLSNVRMHAYDLKTTFTSYGSSTSDGRWILEDTSPGPDVYRWTAEGPSFSGIFLNANKLLSSNQPGGAMPLRLAQVRRAMWGIYFPNLQPFKSLRVANGTLAGAGIRCVLFAPEFSGASQDAFASGRSFLESEYCVNTQTGLLETFSPCAGLYVRYDYGSALHFHEQIIPNGFTITERGKTIIEAKTESVGDAPPKDSGIFQPSGLNPLGVGQLTAPPMTVWSREGSESLSPGSPGQVVVVHGIVSPDHQLVEAEVVASTNEGLDQAALEDAKEARVLGRGFRAQPGTTPQSREIIFTMQFVPRVPRTNFPSAIPQ
jgi:hypothetical protein